MREKLIVGLVITFLLLGRVNVAYAQASWLAKLTDRVNNTTEVKERVPAIVQNIGCILIKVWCPSEVDQTAGIPTGQAPTTNTTINLPSLSSVGNFFAGLSSLFGNRSSASGSNSNSSGRQSNSSGVANSVSEDGSSISPVGEAPGSQIRQAGEMEFKCEESSANIQMCVDIFEQCSSLPNGCPSLDDECNSSAANLDYCKRRGYMPRSGQLIVSQPTPSSFVSQPNPTSAPDGSEAISACAGINMNNYAQKSVACNSACRADSDKCLARINACKAGKVRGGDCDSFSLLTQSCCGWFQIPACSKLPADARQIFCGK